MQDLQADGPPDTRSTTKAKRDRATPRIERTKQPAPELTLRMLDLLHPEIEQWVVMGLDPSLPRIGNAFMLLATISGDNGPTARGPPCQLLVTLVNRPTEMRRSHED